MNGFILRFGRHLALCLAILVSVQMSEAAVLPLQQEPAQQQPAPQQPAAQQQPAPQQPPSQQPPAQQPAAQQPAQQQPAAQQPDAAGQAEPDPGFASRSQDRSPNVEQRDAQNPVGTAAAPVTRSTGVAGSRPAGAAIAPAKQKRAKAIFIRVGLIVAGAAAAGAVYGLTKGSPSHPQ